ncbi:rho GTPase-activating protein 31 isoform X1 [Monodelphis domestica]|uniref:rho GTPase-activating protein 31 isoform X1 n=1 Tax=Monodelphis domestica TaxID=13616 RepID=UPI0024E23952|nr:rho GTPase-activating protein 31 isoform X1 [Monodelphis domestica]
MKNKGAKQKLKRKGATGAFGCDLTEYLETSGQDVPYVLRSCAEFIETHGIVDGIYRLSGVTSNIQKLRQEFGSDQCPDLTREVYLQDIHCVGSLCKLYFRELPNPLLTYELYEKFTQAVSHCPEEEGQLARIQNVIQELPPPHYRTLEYLIRHLTHIASFSSKTNMHTRNLALVWAPNLLRSKEIEAIGCNGDAAFLAVRVQQVVIEFILNHVDQIFSSSPCSVENDENRPIMKSLTLPALSLPMKLVSLEEAQARSLATNHPARKERRENSLPEIVPPTGALFHTVLELPDNKRKLSSKSKKWKSIFNLGRSGSDSKSKLNRNGSVFVRGQRLSVEKATIRPAKSMDSLCSMPVEGKDTKGHFNRTVTTGGFFIPAMKLQTTSSGSSCDLSKQEGEWGQEGAPAGAEGGAVLSGERSLIKSPQARAPPEQLKVFRAVEDPENDQASPKMLAMFYTSNDSASKSVFTSSLFQMESSPRHQRKALNISEPFAVSVPLRVSAVISTNSTPCRTPPKELQSLSSLEESSLQGAEGGGWPGFEEEKTPAADASAASVPQKLKTIKSESVEETKPVAEKERTVECSCNHSPEPSTHPGEKAMESLPFSTTPEKRQEAEGAPDVNESHQSELSAQQESLKDKKQDAMFLSELDEDDSSSPLMWPEIQQELKIIESEEELQALPSSAQKINSSQPVLISSPKTTLSPWARGFSDDSSLAVFTMEETMDKVIQVPPPEGTVVPISGTRGDSEQLNSQQRTEEKKLLCEHNRQEDSTRTPVLEMIAIDPASPQDSALMGSSGSLPSSPPPLEQTLQREDSVINSPVREETSEAMEADPHSDQTLVVDSPEEPRSSYLQEEGVPAQGEKQSPKEKTDKLGSGGEGLLREFRALPHKERDATSQMLETFDYDEEDTSADIAPQSLEMVEPWEDHQWVTSPLHSPTLKDLQGAPPQDLLVPNQRGKRLPHRPTFVQSHSLDSETTMKNQWTLPFSSSSSCVSLGSMMVFDPLQLLAPNREKAEWEKAPRHSKELSESEGTEDGVNSGTDIQSQTVRTSPVCFTEKETKVDQENLLQDSSTPMNQRGSCGLASESIRENSPSGVRVRASAGMPPLTKGELLPSPKLQLKNHDCAPPKGKNRPSSLNLDCIPLVNDFFRFENTTSLGSPGHQLKEQGEAKGEEPNYPWSPICMTSPHSTADPWKVHGGPQDLDVVTHALTGRRNSAPVSVSAVRTSFMVKMCQAKAVPVIPPKVQYTQIPQPLQAQNTEEDVLSSEEKAKVEASPTGEMPLKSAGDDSPPSLGRAQEESTTQEGKGTSNSTQMDSTSFVSDDHILSPDPKVSCLLSSQDASGPCRKRISETEPSGDNPLSSKIERSSGVSKPFHRSRPGRPQSLILFSPPFPIMDHPSSSSDSKVLLSPIRSPTQTISSGLICGELAENTWVTPEGVTLRNKMTIPKNGQRLETSTSCFYQPQRRSVILDGRSGRQIE